MKEDVYTTIRIWRSTLKNLRMLHAMTGESMVSLLDRIIIKELWEVQKAEEKKAEENKGSSQQ